MTQCRIMSVSEDAGDESDKVAGLIGRHEYKSSSILVMRGDYAPLMQNMIQNLEKAKVSKYYYSPISGNGSTCCSA